ncbi:MAG: family 78 glycoside hydrolase catalytic domain [Tannerellaceae bacterium]|nr:family 78 glycoside hydrolase catalytic domain [Tannerellaceae bacterium]
MRHVRCMLFLLFLLVAGNLRAEERCSLFHLTCEQEENPVGIETFRPRFSWRIQAEGRGFEQSAWQILVAGTEEQLLTDSGNLWDSGKVDSSASILLPYAGKTLEAGKRYFWKARVWDRQGKASPWSLVNRFQMGLPEKKDWGKAQWIALEKDRKEEILTTGTPVIKGKKIGMYLLPQFRKEFAVGKEIRNATAYVSGMGHFELFLNGHKVGDHFLDPGWTKYDKHALYLSFDLTGLLKRGNNAVGVMLGNGFYNTPRERYLKLVASYGAPKMIMKIHIDYTDGSREDIVSAPDWKAAESPITFSSIYGGEDYDANREQAGWMLPGFDDRGWKNAVPAGYSPTLVSQRATPLKIRDRLPTVRLIETAKGDWVYDLGQNFSGILKLTVKAADSRPVKLHPAELLNPDNTVNQSATGHPFYFTYTPKGGGVESWQPRFSYYGFRYVQLEGAVPAGKPNPAHLPEVVDITGLHTCNSAEEVGTFHCSSDMFNSIYRLIDWSIRSNMASVLTDCPHREKLGWLEQAYLMQHSIQYRYDIARLYEKTMRDMQSAQADNGLIPDIAPELVEFEGGFKDTPEWGSAFIICPWYIYRWYGDRSLIETYYPGMQRYMDYLASKADRHIIAYGLGDWFDIGPRHPGSAQLTSNGVTATATYYYNTLIMQQIAALLGKEADAARYGALAAEIKQAFNKTFWDASTRTYDRNSQAANAIALYTGLTEEDNREQTLKNLVADIRSRNNALTAGDIGYRYVLRALEANDASDIIYDMNCQYDVPGYGWQLAHGATSLTESWQAYGFVSNNHCMLGHLMEWLFSGLGGLRQAEHSVGMKEIVIKPEVVGDIHSARVSYQSPYGYILSDWKEDEKAFTLRLEVPANSTATVYLPASAIAQVTESGLPLSEADGILHTHAEKGRLVVKTGSGRYLFRVAKEGKTLRIMSYNVHNIVGMDGIRDYGRIAGVINAVAPDVVAIQEVDSATLRSEGVYTLGELSRLTSMHPTYTPAIDYQGGKYGIGILSKEQPLRVQATPLPGREERRVLLVAEFEEYVFACTHFSLTEEDRLASVAIINEAVKGITKPLFLAGDMNSTPDSPPQTALRETFIPLSDPAVNTIPVVNPTACIDYIYVHKNSCKHTLLRQKVIDEQMASDHLPLFVDVSFY